MEPDLDRLVQQLYAGILSPQGWRPALMGLRCLANSEQVTFLIHEHLTGVTRIGDGAHVDRLLISDYEDRFNRIDPVRPVAEAMAPGAWFLDREHLGAAVIDRHAFYQDFLRRHGLTSVMCSTLYGDARHVAAISFQAGEGRPAFTTEDTRRLQPILPHLMQAARLRLETGKLAHAALVGEIMLDSLVQAVFVINCSAEILFSNRCAESWLETAAEARAGVDGHVTDALHAALLHLARSLCCNEHEPYAHAAIRVAGRTRRLLGFGLPDDHPLTLEFGEPVAVVLVQGHACGASTAMLVFKDMFTLTAAEMRVVEALEHHDDLAALARHLLITHETARAHLKSIFLKTGCHSQNALRRLWTEITSNVISTRFR